MADSEYLYHVYAEDVVAGRVVAGRWTRLACERHLRDMEEGGRRGLWFDEESAQHIIDFYSFLRHSKGRWAGTPLLLEPWQQFFVGTLFGWMREDGTRRFRYAYLEVGRKNGKSTLLSGTGLYLVAADGEMGAEVYTAATKRAQARIIHQESINMVRQSPFLSRILTITKDNIHMESTMSKFEPLGRDSKTLDGLNVHGAIIDELHAHPTGDMWDVLETGTGARDQPLMVAITTAGSNRHSICYQLHDYTKKVLQGIVEDDSWHGVIYALDVDPDTGELEDWENEDVWVKANPNLGVSKGWDGMREKARKAKAVPARLNAFLQKELNVWTQASTRWLNPDRWNACNYGPVREDDLRGRRCWGGLDLSSTLDVTAAVFVFEPMEGRDVWDVVCMFWLPEENLMERVKRDRVPYDAWVRDGFLKLTPGDVVDYDFIEHELAEALDRWRVMEIAFDPWNATSVVNRMQDRGAVMVGFRQGYKTMNPAMKSLEVAVQRRVINHQGNPVLSWMADNLVASRDPAGNMKPDKEKSVEKIDGIVALLMAYHRATLQAVDDGSVYSSDGLFLI